MVCDFQELYRHLIDDFLIQFSRKLTEKLNSYFEKKIKISKVKYGKRQQIESLINEEAYLLAKYLRDQKQTWKPRLPQLTTEPFLPNHQRVCG